MRHDNFAIDRSLAEGLDAAIGVYPDFPKPGVLFRDVAPLLADRFAKDAVVQGMSKCWETDKPAFVLGMEARGFIFGAALAEILRRGFLAARKPGKLPGQIDEVAYALEYGEAKLQLQRGFIEAGDSVLIVDDLLATGGTAEAAAELVLRQGGRVKGFAFVVELDNLKGRARLERFGVPVRALLGY